MLIQEDDSTFFCVKQNSFQNSIYLNNFFERLKIKFGTGKPFTKAAVLSKVVKYSKHYSDNDITEILEYLCSDEIIIKVGLNRQGSELFLIKN